uniref:SERPIN domain-containing protein n=1 Tax=Macrostomum lignano TaxID=282301 RepID=A0A1I8JQN7_9PLAT
MSFAEGLDTSVQAQLQAFQSKDAKFEVPTGLAKVAAVPILTEIFVGKNIQFLDQEDEMMPIEEEIYNSQPYACGQRVHGRGCWTLC